MNVAVNTLDLLAQTGGGDTIILILMLAAVLVLGFVFYRQYNLTKNSSGKGSFERKNHSTTTKQSVTDQDEPDPEQLKNEFESILYELRDFVSESMAKLDTKVRYLNQLIMEADKKIEQLEQLKENNSDESRPEQPTSSRGQPPEKKQSGPNSQNNRTVPPGTDAPENELTDSTDEEREEFTELHEETSREDEPIQNKPMYQWVWRLADRELDRQEIAEKTGLEEAEVDVILGMRDVHEDVEQKNK